MNTYATGSSRTPRGFYVKPCFVGMRQQRLARGILVRTAHADRQHLRCPPIHVSAFFEVTDSVRFRLTQENRILCIKFPVMPGSTH